VIYYKDFVRLTKIAPLYYFYGEERLHMEEALEKLKVKVVGAEKHNLLTFDKKVSPGEIITAASVIPMFGKRKLVVIKNAAFSAWDDFKEYFTNPSKDSCLVFVTSKYEMPKRLQKIFEVKGVVVNFTRVVESRLAPYIKDLFRSHGKSVTKREINLIVSYLGNDLMEIDNEVKKLVIYVGNKDHVSVDDIQNVLEKSRVGSVFELINFLSDDHKSKALKVLDGLLESGENEFAIFVMIVRYLKQMNDCKKFMNCGVNPKEIGERCGIHSYFVRDTLKKARSMSWERIQKLFELCKWTEKALKYKNTPNRILLERLVLEL